jgi:hypothetical protein
MLLLCVTSARRAWLSVPRLTDQALVAVLLRAWMGETPEPWLSMDSTRTTAGSSDADLATLLTPSNAEDEQVVVVVADPPSLPPPQPASKAAAAHAPSFKICCAIHYLR